MRAGGGVCRDTETAPVSPLYSLLFGPKGLRQDILCLRAFRRLLQRLPFTATLGEVLLAERLRTALERASAFVLAHEAAARDIGRCGHPFLPPCPSSRLRVQRARATACAKQHVFPSAARYELLQEMDEDEDELLDTSAMSQKEAARESATRQVLDESAKVSVCRLNPEPLTLVGKPQCICKAFIAMLVQGTPRDHVMDVLSAGGHMQGASCICISGPLLYMHASDMESGVCMKVLFSTNPTRACVCCMSQA